MARLPLIVRKRVYIGGVPQIPDDADSGPHTRNSPVCRLTERGNSAD